MAANLSLKLSNRSRKGAVKKLPASIDVPRTATIEDVKIAIAKEARVGDFNRIGLFDPQTRKILRDRKAIIEKQDALVSQGEILVQDLGEPNPGNTCQCVRLTSSKVPRSRGEPSS